MIRQIVAVDAKNGIARHGVQPWKLPQDEAYFSEQTQRYGATVLMGRTTFEVIGHPLPGRHNLVASHQLADSEGIEVVHDLDQFLSSLTTDLWIIGGAKLYQATILRADELYVTHIEADFACDTFYPAIPDIFTPTSQSPWQEEAGVRFRYVVYGRR